MSLKEDVDFIENLIKIAHAVGTPAESKMNKSPEEINQILIDGVAKIQAAIIMHEATRVVIREDKELVNKIVRKYDWLCRKMGYNLKKDFIVREKANASTDR